MKLTEVTFRLLVKDYMYSRPKYREMMKWTSDFGEEIELCLEAKPYTQESLGYKLKEEGGEG